MKYLNEIRAASASPSELEQLYQTAVREGESNGFAEAIVACSQEFPDNVLLEAWYLRLIPPGEDETAQRRGVNWRLAVPLATFTGLAFWIMSDPRFNLAGDFPFLALIWALVAGAAAIAFLSRTAGSRNRSALYIIGGLVGTGAYATVMVTQRRQADYEILMLLHLPVVAWGGVGLSILRRRSNFRDRFAFLINSLQVFVTGGLFLMAGVAFGGITLGMFEALGITPSGEIIRFLAAGGSGLIPVIAVAAAYDPTVGPQEQRLGEGLSKLISTLMHLLLPLTLAVLVVYLLVIPFNFMEPFRNRDVLIIYNVMLFAIMGLLVGVTPVQLGSVTPKHRRYLRIGIILVSILAVVVSLYAMSATVYRTVQGGITINRLTVIGWNTINIGILALLIYKQFRDGPAKWDRSLQWTFSHAANAYLIWTLFLVIAIPWLFRG